MDGMIAEGPASLTALVNAHEALRAVEVELHEHPLVQEASKRMHRCFALLDAARPFIKEKIVSGLRDDGLVSIEDLPGRVHARVELRGAYSEVTPGSEAARRVVEIIQGALPAELLDIIFIEIGSGTDRGPLASIDYYAGRCAQAGH